MTALKGLTVAASERLRDLAAYGPLSVRPLVDNDLKKAGLAEVYDVDQHGSVDITEAGTALVGELSWTYTSMFHTRS